MSEAGWIQIITLILAALTPLLGMWLKARIDAVHRELNSRLDQWKEESVKSAKEAVEAALARGKLEGPAIPPVVEVEEMHVAAMNVPDKGKK